MVVRHAARRAELSTPGRQTIPDVNRGDETVKRMAFLIALFGGLSTARAQLILPPSSPISWTAGQTDSTAYHWDNFSSGGTYPGPFAPDQESFHPGLPNASLTELSGQAFLTGGGNIYSPTATVAISATLPNYGHSAAPGSAFSTTVFVQTRSLGSELDYANVTLGWIDANGAQTFTPANAFYDQELERVPLGGFGGFSVTHIWGFSLPSNPVQFSLNFSAAGPSMSLDQLRIDTLVTPVPEPSALMFLSCAVAGLWCKLQRSGR